MCVIAIWDQSHKTFLQFFTDALAICLTFVGLIRTEVCDRAPLCPIRNGTARFITFSLIIEVHADKCLQFVLPPELICNKNFRFNEQKDIFAHYRKVAPNKKLKLHYFYHKMLLYLHFQTSLLHMFVLHKDALFHYKTRIMVKIAS